MRRLATSLLILASVALPPVFAIADCNTGVANAMKFALSSTSSIDVTATHQAIGTEAMLLVFDFDAELTVSNSATAFLVGHLP